MKKFLIALIFCLCIGSVVLVGCGDNQNTNPPLDPSITTPSNPSNPETPETPQTPENPDENEGQSTPTDPTVPDPDENEDGDGEHNDDQTDSTFPIELQERLKQSMIDYSFMTPFLDFEQIEFIFGDVLTMKINGTGAYDDEFTGIESYIQTLLETAEETDLEGYHFEMAFDSSYDGYCIATISLINP